jgi:hypothetical protein
VFSLGECETVSLRPAGYAMSVLTDKRWWAPKVAYLSSTIRILSRSGVGCVVIARLSACTGLIRLAGQGGSFCTRVENGKPSWFRLLGRDVERGLRKPLVRDFWLGTHRETEVNLYVGVL